jgi:hypothetical protein
MGEEKAVSEQAEREGRLPSVGDQSVLSCLLRGSCDGYPLLLLYSVVDSLSAIRLWLRIFLLYVLSCTFSSFSTYYSIDYGQARALTVT